MHCYGFAISLTNTNLPISFHTCDNVWNQLNSPSFGTYIIPVVAYNLAFKSTDDMVKKPVVSLKLLKAFNWLIAAFVILGGVGMGGYTSIKGFIEQIDEFDYFAPCYQCNPEL